LARIEHIQCPSIRPELVDGRINWEVSRGPPIDRLPQIVWSNHETWSEANLWALELARKKDIKTVFHSMSQMLNYANWLEEESLEWWHFPILESDRCLHRFRGYLISEHSEGRLAPSTISGRMAAVVRFYRWLKLRGLISEAWPMWSERLVGIRLQDTFGFERTINVRSTDLSIPNAAIAGAFKLEDGVMPLNGEDAQQVMDFYAERATNELELMIKIGFGTGLRLGSILDLKVGTLDHASPDDMAGWYRLDVGPGAKPSVATKYGQDGKVLIPTMLLEELRDYACSARRLLRQAKSNERDRNILFLTRFGMPYRGGRAVHVEISRLRSFAKQQGLSRVQEFYFHRTRATFATMLMRASLKSMYVPDAVQFVREACLHKNESTTLKYVRFVEASRAMAEAADAFTAEFMGLVKGRKDA
jgi:integrase